MVRRGDPLLASPTEDDDGAATMGTEGAADTRDTDGRARFANVTSEPFPLLLALELLELALLMLEAVTTLGLGRAAAAAAAAIVLATGTVAAAAAAGEDTAALAAG